MAYLDALMPSPDEQALVAQQLYPWMKQPGPPSPYSMTPPTFPAATPAARPATPPEAHPAVVPPSAPAAPGAAPTAPVTLGPVAAAAPSSPANVPSRAPGGPISLGTPPARPTPAADALAASKAPDLHGWKKVLDIIGQIKMPALEQAIPGTPGNYRQQVRPLLEKQATEEANTAKEQLSSEKDQSDMARSAAEVRNLDSEVTARDNPKPKTRGVIIKDENGDPVPALQDMKTGAITDDTGKELPNAQMWEKPAAKKEDQQFGHTLTDLKAEILTNPAKYPGGYMEGAAGFKNLKAAALQLDADEAAAKRGPKDTTPQKDARVDRSYQFNAKELDNERKPLEATMAKISAATSNIDLKSPQADALLAPQILSLAAGGTGSGLRMNEAEISRIVGGRTVWESLQASANKWSTDPNHPQIPEAQRVQMVQILQSAAQKGTLKSSIIEWADGALVNTDDVQEHRKIVATARKLMNAVDEGKRIERNKTTGEFRVAGDQTSPAAKPTPTATAPSPKTITINPNSY